MSITAYYFRDDSACSFFKGVTKQLCLWLQQLRSGTEHTDKWVAFHAGQFLSMSADKVAQEYYKTPKISLVRRAEL